MAKNKFRRETVKKGDKYYVITRDTSEDRKAVGVRLAYSHEIEKYKKSHPEDK
jgi:hypothetical protein